MSFRFPRVAACRLRAACSIAWLVALVATCRADSFVASMGGARMDAFEAIVPLDGGGTIAVGWTASGGNEDGWVVEVGEDGQVLRQVAIGGAGFDLLRDAVVLQGGDIVAVGRALSSGIGATGGWIVRFAPDLSVRWQVAPSGSLDLSAIVALPGGDVIVGGWARRPVGAGLLAWWARIDATGAIAWDAALDSPTDGLVKDLDVAPDGDVVLAACQPCGTPDAPDGFVARMDPATGALRWQRHYGGAGWDWPEAVLATPTGDVVVAGPTIITAPEGAMVTWLEGDGTLAWQRILTAGSSQVEAEALANGPAGEIVVAGTGRIAGLTGDVLVGIAPDASLEWSRFHGTAFDFGLSDNHGIAVGLDGSLWSASDRTVAAGGEPDGWIVHADSTGAVDPSCPGERDAAARLVAASLVPRTVDFPLMSIGSISRPTTAAATTTTFVPDEACRGVTATPPTEVSPAGSPQPLRIARDGTMTWEDGAASGSTSFDVYRGYVQDLRAGDHGQCLFADVPTPTAIDPEEPAAGAPFFYLVAGRNSGGRGPLGPDSFGRARAITSACP